MTIIFESMTALANLLEKKGKRYALVTDTHVEKLYGRKLQRQLKQKGFDVELIVIPPGEQAKTRQTKADIEDQMLEHKLGVDTTVIALGGGVVTDLVGFVAATYCRGIPLISVPTTLLGMVDASIGGKTGVNVAKGKNLIGIYHFPSLVLIDPEFLKTLSKEELRNGMAEVIKYGLIASKKLFTIVENGVDLLEAIARSIEIKMAVVEKDPFEQKGYRRVLNFGHTIGHALESLLNYEIGHGDAVAIGMLMESYLSMRMGYLKEQDFNRIHHLLKNQDFPLEILKKVTCARLIKAMALDKKSLENVPRFVLLQSIGRTVSFDGEYCTPVKPKLIEEAYAHFSH